MDESKRPGRPERARRRDDEEENEEPRPKKRRRRIEDDEDDYDDDPRRGSGGVGALIPYKNGKALAAYYCGVFGFIPYLGLLLGPIAIILGILGLKKAKRQPKVGGKGHAVAGIVLAILQLLFSLVITAITILLSRI